MILNNEVLIVVPAYNEEATIARVVTGVHSIGFSCVVIDDGSEDNTFVVAKQAGAAVLRLPFNAGVGGALRCGFRYAVENGYKAVIQCDADGQHQSQYFYDLIRTANETKADLVLGSRFLSFENSLDPHIVRRFAMWCLARVASHATGRKITDSTSGFRLIRQPLLDELAKHLPEYYLGDTFELLIVCGRFGYHVDEIATEMLPRQSGKSSVNSLQSAALLAKALLRVFLGIHFRIERNHL